MNFVIFVNTVEGIYRSREP